MITRIGTAVTADGATNVIGRVTLGVKDTTWNAATTAGGSSFACFSLDPANAANLTCYGTKITDPKGAKEIEVAIWLAINIAADKKWATTSSVYDQVLAANASPCKFVYDSAAKTSASTGTCSAFGTDIAMDDVTKPEVTDTGFTATFKFTQPFETE